MRNDTRSAAGDEPMSMPAFFEYLHEHPATTELSKVLADIVMLRTSGVRRGADREKLAS